MNAWANPIRLSTLRPEQFINGRQLLGSKSRSDGCGIHRIKSIGQPVVQSCFVAAVAGVLANVATVRSSSALAGVRFHATTLCPAATNARARAVPILPVPNTATVSFMLYSPIWSDGDQDYWRRTVAPRGSSPKSITALSDS